MRDELKLALLTAAQSTYRKHGSLEDAAARVAFCETFFRSWLITSEHSLALDPASASGSYYFLFWKNLSVTNASVIELMSLLRTHTRERTSGKPIQVDFISTDVYKAFFSNLWASLFAREGVLSLKPDSDDEQTINTRITDAVNQLIRFHENFFRTTIIFDTYFTSALVHIPLSLSVDIGSLTIESGYVHSSGLALYVRNIEKADQEQFVTRLGHFLDQQKPKRFLVTPYASEFFSPFEAKSSASIRNGLDGVRLQLRKHFFQYDSLLNFLNRLKRQFPDQVLVPAGLRDYSTERAQSRKDGANEDCTIWFVVDAGVAFDAKERVAYRSKALYLMAYCQTHLNSNQLVMFKERKPAWISSTTLPHTLSSAMVNVARSYINRLGHEPGRDRTVIIDPFCGTGTTLFDAISRFDNATVIGLDQSPMMPILVRTNAEFLSASKETIETIVSNLHGIEGHLNRELRGDVDRFFGTILDSEQAPPANSSISTPENNFAYAFRLLIEEINGASDKDRGELVTDAAVTRLANRGFSAQLRALLDSKLTFVTRILVYMLWRALLINTFSIRTEARNNKVVLTIILEEVLRSLKEYTDLLGLLKRRRVGAEKGRQPTNGATKRPFLQCIGSYSREGVLDAMLCADLMKPKVISAAPIDSRAIDELSAGLWVGCVPDSIEVLEKLSPFADVVITDPPYGFNALESISARLEDLYARMVPALVNILRPWGQMMIALPAYAKNGKAVPFYQTGESVIKQVIATVEAKNRRIVRFGETRPGNAQLFGLPWYWGTQNTIERRVVHFVIN